MPSFLTQKLSPVHNHLQMKVVSSKEVCLGKQTTFKERLMHGQRLMCPTEMELKGVFGALFHNILSGFFLCFYLFIYLYI